MVRGTNNCRDRRVATIILIVRIIPSLLCVVRGLAGLVSTVTTKTVYALSCFCSRLQFKFEKNAGTVQ